jgi:hypothetical protein
MYQEYFSTQSLVSQAQLLTCLLRRKEIRPILCFLGINQGDKNKFSDIVLNNIRSLYDLVPVEKQAQRTIELIEEPL